MTTPAACSPAVESITSREITIQTVTSYEDFLALEPEWDRVVEAAGPDHPFLEFSWVRTWWECFGGSGRLHILVLREGEDPIAIAPLMQTTVQMMGIRVRCLGFLYNSHVPRADFLIARDHARVYRTLWRALSDRRSWDLLQLCQLPENSPTLGAISVLAAADGFAAGRWFSGAAPFVDTRGLWTDYFDKLPAKHRANMRNRTKRIREFGEIQLDTVTTMPCVEEALRDGFRIEASAWKGAAGTAIACDDAVRRFYSDFARQAAGRGWLRLNFLRAGDQKVAFDYSLVYAHRTYLLKLGYDAAFAAYAPSQILLTMVLREAFERGRDRYDFLGEFVEWKRAWAQESTAHNWLFVTAPSVRGRLLHAAKFRLAPLARRLLRRS